MKAIIAEVCAAVLLAATSLKAQTVITNTTFSPASQSTTVVGPSTIQTGANVTIAIGARVTFQAQSSITFLPGFIAQSGCFFLATANTTLQELSNLVESTVTPTGGVSIAWFAPSDLTGIAGYDVFRDNVLLTTSGPIAASSTSYTDNTAASNTTYYYTVVAVNSSECSNFGFQAFRLGQFWQHEFREPCTYRSRTDSIIRPMETSIRTNRPNWVRRHELVAQPFVVKPITDSDACADSHGARCRSS